MSAGAGDIPAHGGADGPTGGARHLEPVAVAMLGRAGIDELLSRTDLGEAAALLRMVRANPYSALAERVVEVCTHREDPVAATVLRLIGRWRAALPGQRLDLPSLRRRQGQTQADVARSLATGQSDVSKLERGRDPHLSTLARYVAALGGRLELQVRWADGQVDQLRLPQLEVDVPTAGSSPTTDTPKPTETRQLG